MSWLTRTTCVGLFLFASGAMSPAGAQTPAPPQTHIISLSNATVSVVDGSRVVVTMLASGEIRGLLTLNIGPGSDGTIGGDWALVSRFAEYLDENGHVIPEGEQGQHAVEEEHAEHHRERVTFIDRGTLSGAISTGVLTLDANGAVSRIDGAILSINSSSLSFAGSTGDGTAVVINLSDVPASSGTLTLNY